MTKYKWFKFIFTLLGCVVGVVFFSNFAGAFNGSAVGFLLSDYVFSIMTGKLVERRKPTNTGQVLFITFLLIVLCAGGGTIIGLIFDQPMNGILGGVTLLIFVSIILTPTTPRNHQKQ